MDPDVGRRVHTLDALRGLAMVAVCIAHFGGVILPEDVELAVLLWRIGNFGTPAFLLISGVVCAYVWSCEPTKSVAQVRLIDRALFLVIVAHLAVGLSHLPARDFEFAVINSVYVTDALGVSLLIAAGLLGRFGARHPLAIGCALLLPGWIAIAAWHPVGPAAQLANLLLFGVESEQLHWHGYDVPLVPYCGLFLVGLSVGMWLAPHLRVHGDRLTPSLLRTGTIWSASCIAAAVLLKLGWLFARDAIPESGRSAVHMLTDPLRKIPVGAAYVLFFTGLTGLAGVALSAARRRIPGSRLAWALATMGRASLAVYVFQYLLFGALIGLGFTIESLWPLVFAAVLAVVFGFASVWDRAGGNRFLTIGIRSLLDAGLPLARTR